LKTCCSARYKIHGEFTLFEANGRQNLCDGAIAIISSHIVRMVLGHFDQPAARWTEWTPADHMTRQAWQERVEDMVAEIRFMTGCPAFGLTEAEISIHYHQPLAQFGQLISRKLGLRSAQP